MQMSMGYDRKFLARLDRPGLRRALWLTRRQDVLRFLVTTGACAFVVAHNHPSGDPAPSEEDTVLTMRMYQGATLLGFRMLDHVIVTPDASFSFLDSGGLAKIKSLA